MAAAGTIENHAALVEQLVAPYAPSGGGSDELLDADGKVRSHWRAFLESFGRLGPEEISALREGAQRTLREHGVTYNVYGDPQGTQRPWELDILPMIIPRAEWALIEAGLMQRARLFQAILEDVYGRQRLLREGVLPPALVFANPSFLRALHGIRPAAGSFVHLHAVDLARSPDGQWWALADRTQAPSGAGYALENRIVVSRLFPDGFRDAQVERLASFFRYFRDNLRGLSPPVSGNPMVVLLTPGPHNETYFEHAYLARYLGITLVEGADLTVRDRRVFIKNLEGLQRVDVILRRVDDTFCDPLQLRDDSFLGVAGLVEAARAGHVAIANALGAGLLESPAFLAFLPLLCRHLLDEELLLPSVATWWCGQASEQRYVLGNLDRIVVKHAFGQRSKLPVFGRELDRSQRARLEGLIKAKPFDFVGQEQVILATTPVWHQDRLAPRPAVLRAYVAASAGGAMVMSGGLARVSTSLEDPIVSMQSGGGSKDVWIVSDTPVKVVSLLNAAGQPVTAIRSSTDLPSRVADNLFWLGRYSERLEEVLRLIRCILNRMTDEPAIEALAALTERLGFLAERAGERFRLADFERDLLGLIHDPARHGSVRELAGRIGYLASSVRDRFSADTWRILSQIEADVRVRPNKLTATGAVNLSNKLIVDLAALAGMEMENMTRGHGWRFLDVGRRLERAFRLARLLRNALEIDSGRDVLLEALLEIADSSITYRRRYFAQAQLPGVLDLLIFEPQNPRSVAFQVAALTVHGAHLPKAGGKGEGYEDAELIRRLRDTVREARVHWISFAEEGGPTGPLQDYLEDLSTELARLSDRLTHRYFVHTTTRIS